MTWMAELLTTPPGSPSDKAFLRNLCAGMLKFLCDTGGPHLAFQVRPSEFASCSEQAV